MEGFDAGAFLKEWRTLKDMVEEHPVAGKGIEKRWNVLLEKYEGLSDDEKRAVDKAIEKVS